MTDAPIRVTVIGGYLGAGKTTLVNHVLRCADERVAVIVNDFGSVNIDADLIESTSGDTIALTNGCICCSIVDGFTVALNTIRTTGHRPERLVIEASGVAIPSQVAAYAYAPGLELDGVITVVDGETIRRNARNEYIGDVIAQQNTSTDLIVLNKVDLLDDPEVAATTAWLESTTDAPVIAARDGRVDSAVLLDLDPRPNLAAVSATDPPFRTWTETSAEPLDRGRLERQLASLHSSVVRAKGVVRFVGNPTTAHVVQVVGRRVDISPAGPWRLPHGQIVFIAVGRGPVAAE